jgi:hypothetical protein
MIIAPLKIAAARSQSWNGSGDVTGGIFKEISQHFFTRLNRLIVKTVEHQRDLVFERS